MSLMRCRPMLLLALCGPVLAPGCRTVPTPRSAVVVEEHKEYSLVGAWRSKVHFQSGPFAAIKDLEFMYVFNAGGTMTESSNYDGAPPVPPAYGVWRRTGPGQFEARYMFYVTKAPASFEEMNNSGGWLPAGYGVIMENVALSEDGNSFRSSIRYEPFDLSGNSAGPGSDASGSGMRLQF